MKVTEERKKTEHNSHIPTESDYEKEKKKKSNRRFVVQSNMTGKIMFMPKSFRLCHLYGRTVSIPLYHQALKHNAVLIMGKQETNQKTTTTTATKTTTTTKQANKTKTRSNTSIRLLSSQNRNNFGKCRCRTGKRRALALFSGVKQCWLHQPVGRKTNPPGVSLT